MKNRKNDPILFGITLVSVSRTKAANTVPAKRDPMVRRKNLPEKTEQAVPDFDFTRRKLPPGKPFTPDIFTCESRPLPAFPSPGKMSKEMERIHKELERSHPRTASHRHHYRTASQPPAKKVSPIAVSIPWSFFKIVYAGVFVFLKYAFIAVALIITIGCMICAGRQTGGLK